MYLLLYQHFSSSFPEISFSAFLSYLYRSFLVSKSPRELPPGLLCEVSNYKSRTSWFQFLRYVIKKLIICWLVNGCHASHTSLCLYVSCGLVLTRILSCILSFVFGCASALSDGMGETFSGTSLLEIRSRKLYWFLLKSSESGPIDKSSWAGIGLSFPPSILE